MNEGDTNTFSGKYSLMNYLNGYRSFIISIQKKSDSLCDITKYQKIIDRIEKQVLIIESIKPIKDS